MEPLKAACIQVAPVYMDLEGSVSRERGEEPDKLFCGRLMLRLPPDLHRRLHVG